MKQLAMVRGDIWTMESKGASCEALLIQNNRITAVGSSEEILQRANEQGCTNVIDLQGRTVLPGFNDAHMHLAWYTRTLLQANCSYPACASLSDIKKTLKEHLSKDHWWVEGFGYDHNQLEEMKHPTRQDLDEISQDRPIVLYHVSGHMLVANGAAMSLANITQYSPDPSDGHVEKDPFGRPTGLFFEGAQQLIIKAIPGYKTREIVKGYATACQHLLQKGITSIHDPGVGEFGEEELEAYYIYQTLNQHTVRFNLLPTVDSLEKLVRMNEDSDSWFNKLRRQQNQWLRVNTVKMFYDGSLIGKTAAVYKDCYRQEDPQGIVLMEKEELKKIIEYAHQSGIQTAVHAIGERAVDDCLEVYEGVLENHPETVCKHRIEHCGMIGENGIKKLKKLNLMVASQPNFISEFGDSFIHNIAAEKRQTIYRFRSLTDQGIVVAFSSDAPVGGFDPLRGIQAAVYRKTQKDTVLTDHERMNLYDAVKAYTTNGAILSMEHQYKGYIRPGYLADLIVLSAPLSLKTLDTISVEKTYVDGNKLFSS